ncbi:polypeptide N-acetylgalactosaminyltransferase 1-like [Contarinia nasturtii]|uniref:polypeptide N-acetylgalactosaminyltransferase 1-like n=1 Tax=Contarinia nasturtii TaxID=265458 RepID=UPI0012D478B5|nr:polypeptide N-acetylgalactosaminyltransferase 1-like [Contarinia nasturtii]
MLFSVKNSRGCFKRAMQVSKRNWLCLILIFLLYLSLTNISQVTYKKNGSSVSYDKSLHSNWMFKISKNYDYIYLREWTEPTKVIVSVSSGRGENGTAFVPTSDEKPIMEKRLKEQHYNVLASEKMSLRRSLPDYRFPECRSLIYPKKLPTATVIIVVHNEIWATLLRTVWSIIDRSPRELIEEIIIVDDASTWTHLKQPLDDYAKTLPANIKIMRTENREGLIRARIKGANMAKGNILIFLDAHIECTEGWLQPILSRIAWDRSVVAVPLIDGISTENMGYQKFPLEINGLHWSLIFDWMPVPEREIIRTKHDRTAPLRTPTHIGCAFAMDREFFFEIGSYDEGMDIWGSENVELAWRTWMCGGSLEILPCSRVAHLFRSSTYSFDGNAEQIKTRNNNRLIEVWMDEFKNRIYAAYPRTKSVSPGDLTQRKNLRKQLNCKSFRWYLENIYPESAWFKEFINMGSIKNVAENKCLDAYTIKISQNLMTYSCHNVGGAQFFAFSTSGQIMTFRDPCVGIGSDKKSVVVVKCSETDKSQFWDYKQEEKWIVHRESNLCMTKHENRIIIDTCNPFDNKFKWELKSGA